MRLERRDFLRLGTAGIASLVGTHGAAGAARRALNARGQAVGSSQLSIEFAGLITLVPRPSRKRMELILLKSALHSPRLAVKSEDLVTDHPLYAPPDQEAESVHQAISIWDLSGYDVEIGAPGESSLSWIDRLRGQVPPPTCPAALEDWRDLYWIADLRAICGPGVSPRAGCCGADWGDAPIAARFRLTSGTVEGGVPIHPALRDEIWSVGPHYQQVLGDAVWYTTDPGDSPTVIKLTKNGGMGADIKAVVLSPKNGGTANVSVMNSPVPSTGMDDPDRIGHFGAFYDLLAGAHRSDIPQRIGSCRRHYPELQPIAYSFRHPIPTRCTLAQIGSEE